MSLVGTRPPTVEEVAQYEEHHRTRLAIKPGITEHTIPFFMQLMQCMQSAVKHEFHRRSV